MKLWVKVIKGEKIVTSILYDAKVFDVNKLLDYLTDICFSLDLPRPMLIEKHYRDFKNFNHTIFKASDLLNLLILTNFGLKLPPAKTKNQPIFTAICSFFTVF